MSLWQQTDGRPHAENQNPIISSISLSLPLISLCSPLSLCFYPCHCTGWLFFSHWGLLFWQLCMSLEGVSLHLNYTSKFSIMVWRLLFIKCCYSISISHLHQTQSNSIKTTIVFFGHLVTFALVFTALLALVWSQITTERNIWPISSYMLHWIQQLVPNLVCHSVLGRLHTVCLSELPSHCRYSIKPKGQKSRTQSRAQMLPMCKGLFQDVILSLLSVNYSSSAVIILLFLPSSYLSLFCWIPHYLNLLTLSKT